MEFRILYVCEFRFVRGLFGGRHILREKRYVGFQFHMVNRSGKTFYCLQFTGHIVHTWHSGRIRQLIGLCLNEGMLVDRFWANVGQSFFVCVFHDLHGDLGRALSDRGQRRVKAALFQIAGLHQTGQFLSSIKEDLFWNGGGSGANHAQRNAREDVRVVALTGIEGLTLVGHRIEGRAR